MNARRQRNDPAPWLSIEVAGYRALLDLLQAEQDALRRADADALAQVVPAKLKQVHQLEDMAGARTRAMADAGFTPIAAGIDAWLGSCEMPVEAARDWAMLVELATRAQRQNMLNYQLAAVQERHVDRAITALWNAAGVASTYSADGRSRHHAHSRALAAI